MGGDGRSWEVINSTQWSSAVLSGPHLVDEGRGECEIRLESHQSPSGCNQT